MIILKDDLYNHYEDINCSNIQISLTDVSMYRFVDTFLMQKVFLDNYLVIYVVEGNVKVEVDDNLITLGDKNLLFLPPYRVVHIKGDDNVKPDTVFFTLDFTCDNFVFFELISYTHINNAGMIEMLITELYNDCSRSHLKHTKDAKLLIVLEKICELLKPKSNNRQLVDKIIEYINENIMLNIDLDTLSEELNYNKDYLGRIFKKELDISINNYINSEKIKMSKKLLNNTNMTIAAIAKTLGWEDPNKYLKFFKYHEGMTPTQYREKGANANCSVCSLMDLY